MLAYCSYHSPLGILYLVEENQKITHLSFSDKVCEQLEQKQTPLLTKATEQLSEYFSHKRSFFDLPLAPKGTAFQQKVWQALLEIPYGQTASYADIATRIQNPKACRAVGMANHQNPIAILIPCHRVIGKSGSLTGYAGGLSIKKYLLNLEKESSQC